MTHTRFSFDRPVILQYINNGFSTFIEISADSGMPEMYLMHVLRCMKTDGLISSPPTPRGFAQHYTITPRGRERLAEYPSEYPILEKILTIVPKKEERKARTG